MYIKIVRLRAICSELKRKISASSGLGRLQMVSKPDIGQCANEDVGPQRGWIVRSHVGCRVERARANNIF